MKKGILSLSLIVMLFSCGEKKEVDVISVKSEDLNSNELNKSKNENVIVKDLSVFESAIEDYKKCKEKADKKYACKEFTAKAICEAYGLNDFKEGDNYIDYDKIPSKIKELSNWEKIGSLTSENIEKAFKQLNDFGLPVIVFDNKHTYSPVSILKENGKTSVSRKWGNLTIPSVVSFHSTKGSKSSSEKGLNLVYSGKENLEIWYRKSE